MINNNQVDTLYIKWEKDSEPVLIIMLNRNGAVNRMGGGEEKKKPVMVMGKTAEPLFNHLLEAVDPTWFEYAGRYIYPSPKGVLFTLTISFEGTDLDTGFSFTYGSQSEGPPEDIVAFVEYAATLTDPWFEEQLSRQNQSKKKRTR